MDTGVQSVRPVLGTVPTVSLKVVSVVSCIIWMRAGGWLFRVTVSGGPWKAETRGVKASSVRSPLPRSSCVSILTLVGLSYLRTRRWRCLPMWPAVSQMIHHHRCRFIIGRSPRAPRSSQISGKCQPSDERADCFCHVQWALCKLHAPKPEKSGVGRYVCCVCVCSTCYVPSIKRPILLVKWGPCWLVLTTSKNYLRVKTWF